MYIRVFNSFLDFYVHWWTLHIWTFNLLGLSDCFRVWHCVPCFTQSWVLVKTLNTLLSLLSLVCLILLTFLISRSLIWPHFNLIDRANCYKMYTHKGLHLWLIPVLKPRGHDVNEHSVTNVCQSVKTWMKVSCKASGGEWITYSLWSSSVSPAVSPSTPLKDNHMTFQDDNRDIFNHSRHETDLSQLFCDWRLWMMLDWNGSSRFHLSRRRLRSRCLEARAREETWPTLYTHVQHVNTRHDLMKQH